MRVIIVGGIAGGAGAAARLRRLDEKAEIILVERGANISYANCGLPYSLGKVIPERESLLLMTPELFRARFNVDVRVRCEALSINRENKSLRLRDLNSGTEKEVNYDKLILATGSLPCPLPIPGVDLPGIHRLWTLDDMDRLEQSLGAGAKRAVVAGGGFVGVELAENLQARGLEVTLVELADFIMPSLDQEMSNLLVEELRREGLGVELGVGMAGVEKTEDGLLIKLSDGRGLNCDLGVLCLGVKPNSELAKAAGLELGPRGHIVVDEKLCTSDPDVYAVGDVIEVIDPVFKGKVAIALAGPANKQARIVADNICGRNNVYKGTLGTSIIKVNQLTAASVGYSERLLKNKAVQYKKIYLHPNSHATYYPGGTRMHMKVLFNDKGRIFGAQIVGQDGVDKRIDVLATAMLQGMDIRELGALELAYAPPYSSAKDPVNFVGMIAENILDGTSSSVHFEDLPKDAFLLDIREKEEFELGGVPGAVNIPMAQLRERHSELPRDREIFIYCQSGVRSYVMERALKQLGYKAATVSGGILTWRMQKSIKASSAPRAPEPCCVDTRCQSSPGVAAQPAQYPAPVKVIDVRSLACPGPVVRLKQEIELLREGQVLAMLAPLSFEADLRSWSRSSGNQVLQMQSSEGYLEALVQKGGAKREEGEAGAAPDAALAAAGAGSGAAIVLFSNDLDKAMAALIIACGMAASGQKVGIFFTFWGLSVLRKSPAPAVKKDLVSRMFGWMLPKGAAKLSLSKMNMGGMGTAMMKQVMKRENVSSLPELLAQARELGVKFIACEMAMDVMGIKREELVEVDEVAGVASFADMARQSNSSLFI